jgi:hypothetical protein
VQAGHVQIRIAVREFAVSFLQHAALDEPVDEVRGRLKKPVFFRTEQPTPDYPSAAVANSQREFPVATLLV